MVLLIYRYRTKSGAMLGPVIHHPCSTLFCVLHLQVSALQVAFGVSMKASAATNLKSKQAPKPESKVMLARAAEATKNRGAAVTHHNAVVAAT